VNRVNGGVKVATEGELIAALARIFTKPDPNLLVGIGDDAAVIKGNSENLVAATDMAVEGVHFKREWSSLNEIGAKVTAANLADIFAMGGEPKYLLVSAGLPENLSIEELTELAMGIKSEADHVGAAVVGGDISKSEKLVISIAVFGSVDGAITRSGAKVGDSVIISNITGPSAAGLHQLQEGKKVSLYISAHKKPIVRYDLARAFRTANSMCDVSDGLLSELNHIAKASKVGIELDRAKFSDVPGYAELVLTSETEGIDVWQWVLAGGEDHAFVATTSGPIPAGATVIGKVVSGNEVKVLGLSELPTEGFKHF
jgi:thiamine-monophosphate kinase